MFYEDLVESEHYVNDIMKSVTSNSKLLTRLSGENNLKRTKIKSLEEEIKKLEKENATLRENILTQLKIPNLKLLNTYLVTTTKIWQTVPSKAKPSKIMNST